MAALCECGCGGTTSRIRKSVPKRGRVRGEYSRFISGHSGPYARKFRPLKHGFCVGIIDKRYHMWKGSKKRAASDGVPWDLKMSDIPAIPDVCPVLGITLDKNSPTRCDASPSLDRVVPELGYIPGNTRIISWRANDLKKDASLTELQALVTYIQEHQSR